MLAEDILEHHVLRNLHLTELPGVQACCLRLKVVLDTSNTWRLALKSALPQVQVAPELLEKSNRHKFMQTVFPLLKATFARTTEVELNTMQEATQLSKLVKNAQKIAASHTSSGGRSAAVVVGSVQFPRESIRSALAENEASAVETKMSASNILSFRLNKELSKVLNIQGDNLKLQFAWQRGALFMRVKAATTRHGHLSRHGNMHCATPVTVDICSRDQSLILNQRGGLATLNGPWRLAGSGLCSFLLGKESASHTLSNGLLCALCIRDKPEQSVEWSLASPAAGLMAHALHLDTVRGSLHAQQWHYE